MFLNTYISLKKISLSSILEKAQFEITKLEHVLNANSPLYRLFCVML